MFNVNRVAPSDLHKKNRHVLIQTVVLRPRLPIYSVPLSVSQISRSAHLEIHCVLHQQALLIFHGIAISLHDPACRYSVHLAPAVVLLLKKAIRIDKSVYSVSIDLICIPCSV